MIIVHLINDIPTLKACSLTCYSWYIITLPYIHHTFVLRGTRTESLRALSNRHAQGLTPFTKEIQILPHSSGPSWFLPRFLRHRDSCHFFVFTDVRSLTVRQLDIATFIPGLQQYFGHLSPSLRSLTLTKPQCSSMQLSYFISLFPNLDDVAIQFFAPKPPGEVHAPFSTPGLRGKLMLVSVSAVETWQHLATWGGLRFHSISVYGTTKCVPVLLAACANTLKTLRIQPRNDPGMRPRVCPCLRFSSRFTVGYQQTLVLDCNLSRLKVLRLLGIQTPHSVVVDTRFHAAIESIFSTITTPNFSDLMLILWPCGRDCRADGPPTDLFEALRRMYLTRPFRLIFLFVTGTESGVGWGQRWQGWINAAADGGSLRCFKYPPSVHFWSGSDVGFQ